MSSDRTNYPSSDLFFIISIVLGVLIFTSTIFWGFGVLSNGSDNWVETKGVIIAVDYQEKNNTFLPKLDIEYQVDGKIYQATNIVIDSKYQSVDDLTLSYNIGDQITLYYYHEDPSIVSISNDFGINSLKYYLIPINVIILLFLLGLVTWLGYWPILIEYIKFLIPKFFDKINWKLLAKYSLKNIEWLDFSVHKELIDQSSLLSPLYETNRFMKFYYTIIFPILLILSPLALLPLPIYPVLKSNFNVLLLGFATLDMRFMIEFLNFCRMNPIVFTAVWVTLVVIGIIIDNLKNNKSTYQLILVLPVSIISYLLLAPILSLFFIGVIAILIIYPVIIPTYYGIGIINNIIGLIGIEKLESNLHLKISMILGILIWFYLVSQLNSFSRLNESISTDNDVIFLPKKHDKIRRILKINHYYFIHYQNGEIYYVEKDARPFHGMFLTTANHELFRYEYFYALNSNSMYKYQVQPELKLLSEASMIPFDNIWSSKNFIFVQRDELLYIFDKPETLGSVNQSLGVIEIGNLIIEIIQDKNHISVIYEDGKIMIYLYTGSELIKQKQIELKISEITVVSKSQNDLYFGSKSGDVFQLNLRTFQMDEFPSNDLEVTAILATTEYLVVGLIDGAVQIISIQDELKTIMRYPFTQPVTSLSLDNTDLLVGSRNGFISLLSLDTILKPESSSKINWLNPQKAKELTTCAICKKEVNFKADIVKCTYCKVTYHLDEISSWLALGRSKKGCPICKKYGTL